MAINPPTKFLGLRVNAQCAREIYDTLKSLEKKGVVRTQPKDMHCSIFRTQIPEFTNLKSPESIPSGLTIPVKNLKFQRVGVAKVALTFHNPIILKRRTTLLEKEERFALRAKIALKPSRNYLAHVVVFDKVNDLWSETVLNKLTSVWNTPLVFSTEYEMNLPANELPIRLR